MISFKGSHFPKEVIMQAIRWNTAYSLSYRDVEKLLEERGLELDHATINKWVIKYSPLFELKFRTRKKAVGKSWRMDETYIKVKGQWFYYYRAVYTGNQTIDFMKFCKKIVRLLLDKLSILITLLNKNIDLSNALPSPC